MKKILKYIANLMFIPSLNLFDVVMYMIYLKLVIAVGLWAVIFIPVALYVSFKGQQKLGWRIVNVKKEEEDKPSDNLKA